MHDVYLQQSISTVLYGFFYLTQLYGTFHFVLIWAVLVDKGGNINVRLHVLFSASLLAARRLVPLAESGDGPSVSS